MVKIIISDMIVNIEMFKIFKSYEEERENQFNIEGYSGNVWLTGG